MSLYLRNKIPGRLPIDVRTVTPELFMERLPLARIAKQKIRYGNMEVELGELFEVSSSGSIPDVVWQGELESVNHMGSQHRRLTMRIEGNAGRHVGSRMEGGEIIISGNVGDYLGSQMSGGTIRVKGSAGHFVGGRLAGAKSGVNRGNLLIDGDAGDGMGHGMRRGLIAVRGNAGCGLAWNMLAGSIVVLGSCPEPVGNDMQRGTIILAGDRTPFSNQVLPANYRYVGRYEPPLVPLVSRWLRKLKFEFPSQLLDSRVFDQFAGDWLNGGRGEVFCGVKN